MKREKSLPPAGEHLRVAQPDGHGGTPHAGNSPDLCIKGVGPCLVSLVLGGWALPYLTMAAGHLQYGAETDESHSLSKNLWRYDDNQHSVRVITEPIIQWHISPYARCSPISYNWQGGMKLLVGYVCSEVLDRVSQWEAAGLSGSGTTGPMTYGRVAAGRSEGDNRAPD